MTDVNARIAELESQLLALKAEVAETEVVTDRRGLLKKAAFGAAAAGAGALALTSRPAAALDGGTTLTDATTVSPLTYTGADLTTVSALSVGETVTATSVPVPLFPAAVGGYGAGTKIPNGLHGSTTAPGGSGIVAANVATTLAATELGSAATVVTNKGVHFNFVTLTTDAPEAPKAAGLLYKDKDGNLWFSIPTGPAPTDPAAWQIIAGPASGYMFYPLGAATRVLDTRSGAKVPNNATVPVDVTKDSKGAASGVPVSAVSVLLNLTLDATEGQGFHVAYSSDLTAAPTASSINWDAVDQIRANLAVSGVGADGKIKMSSGGGGTTHLIIDAIGYYA
jgi:hypothetical protein